MSRFYTMNIADSVREEFARQEESRALKDAQTKLAMKVLPLLGMHRDRSNVSDDDRELAMKAIVMASAHQESEISTCASPAGRMMIRTQPPGTAARIRAMTMGRRERGASERLPGIHRMNTTHEIGMLSLTPRNFSEAHQAYMHHGLSRSDAARAVQVNYPEVWNAHMERVADDFGRQRKAVFAATNRRRGSNAWQP
jgi:hypothetical protein